MSIGGTRAESVSRFLLQCRRHLRDSMQVVQQTLFLYSKKVQETSQ